MRNEQRKPTNSDVINIFNGKVYDIEEGYDAAHENELKLLSNPNNLHRFVMGDDSMEPKIPIYSTIIINTQISLKKAFKYIGIDCAITVVLDTTLNGTTFRSCRNLSVFKKDGIKYYEITTTDEDSPRIILSKDEFRKYCKIIGIAIKYENYI